MKNVYNGSLTREKFLFYEMRIVAKLCCNGMNRKDILDTLQKDNLFQFPTEKMVVNIANTCFKRIDALNSPALVSYLAELPAEDAKQINLYAMMKYNKLVWDFMVTLIGEKYRTQDFELPSRDINVFMERLREQNDLIAAWSDSTIKKIKQVLIRTLVECGYLDSYRSEKLNTVVIVSELEDAIRDSGDLSALPAFNCFV